VRDVEIVDTSSLVELPGNPRRGDVDAIARSLQAFGQRTALVARRVDRVVLKGNHTLAAARQLGWDQLAVTWVDDDEITAKAYSLADNRTAELGTYDQAALIEMLEAVAPDESLLLATAWHPNELRTLLKRQAATLDVDDDGVISADSIDVEHECPRCGLVHLPPEDDE
jgi:ParB-like chromosome segregation protein Spo0J